MNLFAVSRSPVKCARALDDARLRKMLVETAQMLCTELRRRGYSVPYKSTHAGHPVTKWLQSDGALSWMLRYFTALDREYVYRFGKRHKSYVTVYKPAARAVKLEVGSARPRRPQFANCARNAGRGVDFAHVRPVTRAYRMYLAARWPGDKREPRWTRRSPPKWRRSK